MKKRQFITFILILNSLQLFSQDYKDINTDNINIKDKISALGGESYLVDRYNNYDKFNGGNALSNAFIKFDYERNRGNQTLIWMGFKDVGDNYNRIVYGQSENEAMAVWDMGNNDNASPNKLFHVSSDGQGFLRKGLQ